MIKLALKDIAPESVKTDSSPETQELKVIAKGGTISLVGTLSMMALNLGFQLFLARTLGPAGVGIITLGVSVTGLSGIVALFGLVRGALRFVAHYVGVGDQRRAIGTIVSALCIFGVTTLFVTIAVFIGSSFLAQNVFGKPELLPVLRVLTLSMPFTGLTTLLMTVAQALKRVDRQVLIEKVAVPFLKLVVVILAFYAVSHTSITAAYAILFSAIFGAFLSIISVWQLYPLRGVTREKPILVTRALLGFSWPLLLTELITRSQGQLGILMLGGLASSEELGIYKTGVPIAVLMTLFLAALNTIFAPVIASLYARKDYKRLSSLYKTVTKWAFTFCIPVFIVLFHFSAEILAIFGPEFVAGVPVLRILALSQLVFVASGPVGWILTMTGHPKLNLLNSIATLGISSVLGFLLIPQYGAVGAAVAGAIGTVTVDTLRFVEVYIILHIHPYSWSYLKPVLAGLFATAVVVGTDQLLPDFVTIWRVGGLGIVLSIAYLLILLLLRLDEVDRAMVQAVRRRLSRSAGSTN